MTSALQKSGLAGLLSAIAVIAGFAASQVSAAPPKIEKDLGAYDPEGTFSDRKDVGIEHIFMPWEDVELDSLFAADEYSTARNRTLLVTVEPWTWSRDERNTAEYLQANIPAGTFDANVVAICNRLNELKAPVIMRWGHEMENSEGQFIWSGWEPQTYVDAYRRVVNICKKQAPSVTYMWSPLGDADMDDYYPGDDVVDVVGLSIFGLQEFDNDKFSRDRTLAEQLKPGYERAKQYKKPICVAELGYEGDTEYLSNWSAEVSTSFDAFPDLACVVYFNQQEVYPWPEDYGLPDWRIDQQYF